jgi:hypothetical protein
MSYSFSIKSSNPFTNAGPTVEEPVSTPSQSTSSTNASSSTTASGAPSSTTTSATNLTSSSRRQVSNTGLSIKTTSTAVEDYY